MKEVPSDNLFLGVSLDYFDIEDDGWDTIGIIATTVATHEPQNYLAIDIATAYHNREPFPQSSLDEFTLGMQVERWLVLAAADPDYPYLLYLYENYRVKAGVFDTQSFAHFPHNDYRTSLAVTWYKGFVSLQDQTLEHRRN